MPFILLALGLILYFTVYLVAFVPADDAYYAWRPDNVFRIVALPDEPPPAFPLQPGDVVLSIDGMPARWTLWRPLFPPGKQSHQYTIQRGGQIRTVTVPVAALSFQLIRERAIPGVTAFLTWLAAASIILFATPQNRDAWQLGLTTLSAAVALAASEAALYGVPGAWLFSSPALPFVAVALAHIALLPRGEKSSLREHRIFRALYIGAAILGLAILWELLFLAPRGSSFELITGVSSYELLLMLIAGGALTHLAILGWRFWCMKPSYQRQQILIILVFTAVAILPGIVLTFLPRLLFDVPLLPWDLAFALMVLIPAGYGFVIYRKNFLDLDIFATNTLTVLLISLLLLSSYSFIFHLVQQQSTLAALEPLPGTLFLLPVVVVIPYAARHIQGKMEMIVYGANAFPQKDRLQRLTSALAVDPHVETLKNVLREVAAQMQVRQWALLLTDDHGRLVCAARLRVEENMGPVPLQYLSILPSDLIVRYHHLTDGRHWFLTQFPWADYIVPLAVGETIAGVLLLGQPVPDGYLNSKQIAFLRQVADVMAVTAEAMRLFESSREMSRELLRVRDAERMQLAAQIHDEPLQRISMIASGLGQMAADAATVAADGLAGELQDKSQALQVISKQLRDICAGLHPPILKQGAQWAVKEVVYAFREKTGLDIQLGADVSHALLVPQDVTVAVYYILTEALNNVHKHAQATAVWVHFVHQSGWLLLSVTDNGQHQTISSLSLSALVRARHFGIVGMHEWASLVGGELSVGQREGGGTTVTLQIPFAPLPESASGTSR